MIGLKVLPGLWKQFNNRTIEKSFSYNQFRYYAARKGTRERKRKKIAKTEIKKIGFIPHNQRKKNLNLERTTIRIHDDWKNPLPEDNVWFAKYFRSKVYNFGEAVQCHRETHHPTIYNLPNSYLNAVIELNMSAEKKNRYIDNINQIFPIPHDFDHGEDRSILVLAKDESLLKELLKLGATFAGGVQLIKDIQNGDLSIHTYQHILAHPNILPELISVRGLMRRKFPNPKAGTLSSDLLSAVKRFANGVRVIADKDEFEQDYAVVTAKIGTLNMDEKYLAENFISLIQNLSSLKPRKNEPFITRCFLACPPSKEKFKIEFEKYIEDKKSKNQEVLETEIEEEQLAKSS